MQVFRGPNDRPTHTGVPATVSVRSLRQGSVNEYSFDAVFPPEAGQSEVYEGTAKPHISELLEGINVTVFAYGATGEHMDVSVLSPPRRF